MEEITYFLDTKMACEFPLDIKLIDTRFIIIREDRKPYSINPAARQVFHEIYNPCDKVEEFLNTNARQIKGTMFGNWFEFLMKKKIKEGISKNTAIYFSFREFKFSISSPEIITVSYKGESFSEIVFAGNLKYDKNIIAFPNQENFPILDFLYRIKKEIVFFSVKKLIDPNHIDASLLKVKTYFIDYSRQALSQIG